MKYFNFICFKLLGRRGEKMLCRRVKITVLGVFLFIQLATTCAGLEGQSVAVPKTETEQLSFLVKHSDLIAIIKISKGSPNRRFSLFGMPKQVEAEILSVISGIEKQEVIKINTSPRFVRPRSIFNYVYLRKGRHLVFLSKEENSYKPTTRFSIIEILFNKVYPIWKQDEETDVNEMSAGYSLNEIVDEIKKELENKGE